MASTASGNCIYRYIRKNEKSDDWTEDSKVDIDRPRVLRYSNGHLYVSCSMKLYLVNQ